MLSSQYCWRRRSTARENIAHTAPRSSALAARVMSTAATAALTTSEVVILGPAQLPSSPTAMVFEVPAGVPEGTSMLSVRDSEPHAHVAFTIGVVRTEPRGDRVIGASALVTASTRVVVARCCAARALSWWYSQVPI